MMWAFTLLTGARGMAGKALTWLTASTARLLIAVIALLVALTVWQHARIVARDATINKLRTDNREWAHAFNVTSTSFHVLEDALKTQNAAIDQIKAASDKRTAAGQEALRGAQERSAVREGLAARIDAEKPPQGACRTGPAVLAAKGEL